MNITERWNLAVKTADSIFDDFSKSMTRAVALFGSKEEALKNLIIPGIESALNIKFSNGISQPTNNYTGESRDLLLLTRFGATWKDTLIELDSLADHGVLKAVFKPGDFLFIPISVPEIEIDGVEFPAIEDGNVKVVVTHVFEDKIIFNFENVLFHAPMNSERTNNGGLAKSTLGKYLNSHFLKHVFAGVEAHLAPNNDGLKVSLPTMREVFGDEKYDKVNWGDVVRHPYFVKCTNRIKVNNDDPDDTNWWWLADEYATNTTNFCHVGSGGGASIASAYITAGGVAPAFCVAKRHN
jgi:hypothetical protein